MEPIVQLLISMIVAYEEYGDSVGYTKEELNKFIEQYELYKLNWNELGAIVLYEYKYITKEQFAKSMDLDVDEKGDFWMVFDDFDDVLPKGYDFEATVLDGRIWEDWNPSDYTDYDFDLNDFTEGTLKAIMDYCVRHDCSIESEDDDIILTKDNMRIENDSIYVDDENLDEHMGDDGMEELKHTIQIGIADAHDAAEADAIYDACKSNFEEGIGSYKWVTEKKGEKNVEMLWVKVEADLSDVESELKDAYTWNGKTTYSTEQHDFGNMYHVLNEFDFIQMTKPNYDYLYSYPERKHIDECVRERILYD